MHAPDGPHPLWDVHRLQLCLALERRRPEWYGRRHPSEPAAVAGDGVEFESQPGAKPGVLIIPSQPHYMRKLFIAALLLITAASCKKEGEVLTANENASFSASLKASSDSVTLAPANDSDTVLTLS